MSNSRSKLIAVNFKMNFDHLEMTHYVQKLVWLLYDANHDYTKVQVLLLAPFTTLRSIQTLVTTDSLPILYGSQDVSSYGSGAYTGEISALQLAKLGVSYSLIGHTDRRKYHHEEDEVVLEKATRALEAGIKPIICIGEESEEPREHPDFEFLFKQLNLVVQKISRIGKGDVIPFLKKVVVAYEPRWSVSNGKTCNSSFLQEALAGIRAHIAEELGEVAANKISLVYGGSVNLNSVTDLISEEDVDGLLIGKAALDPGSFAKILRLVSKVVGK
ncbi:MAG: triose-phosphate isomerase [Candidatus Ancillula trichonymphae]|nr:triose-phosphate isomerase [Candidatus Ancillula trichonymphae]